MELDHLMPVLVLLSTHTYSKRVDRSVHSLYKLNYQLINSRTLFDVEKYGS